MNEELIELVLLAHAAACLYMSGVIWLVQIIHYPLFSDVGNANFSSYEKRHTATMTWVVAPPMLIEGVTGVLLFWFPPAGLSEGPILAGLVGLGIIWLSTALIQVPCHEKLTRGFDPVIHKRLVITNWLRTIAWSLRGVLVLWMIWACLNVDKTSPEYLRNNSMASFKIGDRAPDFSAITTEGKQIHLSDYVGNRGLVLFFYPKDGTSVCTKEACAFRDSYEKFSQAGVDIIGISGDSDESHRAFIQQHKLSYPLISDKDGSLRKTFGVKKTMGLIPGRVTFVIDKDGVIRQIFSALFASDEHVRQALAAVSGLNPESR